MQIVPDMTGDFSKGMKNRKSVVFSGEMNNKDKMRAHTLDAIPNGVERGSPYTQFGMASLTVSSPPRYRGSHRSLPPPLRRSVGG
jgi:hypothetical protein